MQRITLFQEKNAFSPQIFTQFGLFWPKTARIFKFQGFGVRIFSAKISTFAQGERARPASARQHLIIYITKKRRFFPMTRTNIAIRRSITRAAATMLFLSAFGATASAAERFQADATPDSTGLIVRVGDVAPNFTATLTNGESITLADMRGKVVMLQFTASWCGVCRKEMPHIESEIWQRHKDNPEFLLYGIDRDEPLATVEQFAAKTGITYPMALDPGADIFALYADREAGITRNILIDRKGRIVKTTRLYNTDEFASLVKAIDEELAK